MFASSFFWCGESSYGTPVSSMEVSELDSVRVASVWVCECMWGPLWF